MSWLADILNPQKSVTPMAIELDQSEPTSPAPEQNNALGPEAAVIEPMHPRLFSADPLSGEDLERHLVAKSNHRLQGLAQCVAAARSRLLDLTAAASAVSAAEDARHFQGAAPEAWLMDELATVQALIEQAEAGRKRADARRVARSQCVTPLISAVGNKHTTLEHERETLWKHRHLLSAPLVGREASPYQRPIDAGLSPEQIALIGATQAPDAARQKDRDRINDRLAETEPQIAAIERWQASGHRDHHHLAGLGFDALIEAAQPVDESEAP